MTLTTQIRFLDPIDPREVWNMAQVLVDVPEGFKYKHFSKGSPIFGTLTYDNAGYRAEPDQGAGALLDLEYGHEGSLLIDNYDEELDGTPIPGPPPAYVELGIDTPYGAAVDHKPWIRLVLAWAAKRGVRALWWEGECCCDWHDTADAGRYVRAIR